MGMIAPGGACSCDAQCQGDAAHPGVCAFGICMTRATGACAMSGSTTECGAGARCWQLEGTMEHLCWPDCQGITCAGECDTDGSCTYTATTNCDRSCGAHCRAPETLCSLASPTGPCPHGERCVQGSCISEGCPDWHCTGADCSTIVLMPGSHANDAEAAMRGYYKGSQARYSYVRKDLTMLIAYAACEMQKRFPGTSPIALADLSQADGRTPGTDVGSPRHGTTTHTGNDMDISYFQTDGANDPQIVCGDGSDTNNNGTAGRFNDGAFCTTDVNIVDWTREGYWFAKLAESPLVRVFGLDQTFPDDLRRQAQTLLMAGEISNEVYERMTILGFGASGGWQYHHHHSHMSYRLPTTMLLPSRGKLDSREACGTAIACADQ